MLAAAGAHAGGVMEVGEEARASGWEEESSRGEVKNLPAAHVEHTVSLAAAYSPAPQHTEAPAIELLPAQRQALSSAPSPARSLTAPAPRTSQSPPSSSKTRHVYASMHLHACVCCSGAMSTCPRLIPHHTRTTQAPEPSHNVVHPSEKDPTCLMQWAPPSA